VFSVIKEEVTSGRIASMGDN